MGVKEADQLESILRKADSWPVWSADRAGGITTGTYAQAGMYGQSLADLALWVAFKEADRKAIKSLTGWKQDRDLRLDPLPEKISGAYSDLLYGANTEFLAPNKDDQEKLDKMVHHNDLLDQLYRWVDQCVSEGEVWWKIYTDPELSEWPIVEAVSRLDVVPLFAGRRIMGAAFISPFLTQEIKFEKQLIVEFWRLVEIQTEGYVRNLLFKGTLGNLGTQVPLGSDPFNETGGLEEEWNHDLPVMLAGRIPNKLGRDWRLGKSEYQGSKDLIEDLFESRTIMAENARNTAKARMVVPAEHLDEFGQFDAGKDVIVAESLDESLEGNKNGPYTVLEYNFQAVPLLAHINELVETILTRCGLAEQFTGGGSKGGEGQAMTGTALRTRLIPTTMAANSKARFWDKGVPHMLKCMAMVANLATENGGCGQAFKEPDGKFEQKRDSVLPEDRNEKTQRKVMGVQGEVESIYTAVRDEHPEWDEDEVQAEIKRIEKDHDTPNAVVVAPPQRKLEEAGEIADAPPAPGEQTSDLRDALGTRQPGTGKAKGQSPGKQSPAVTAGAGK